MLPLFCVLIFCFEVKCVSCFCFLSLSLSLSVNSNYEDFSAYDIADMIKLYYRQLPEPVLTARFSEMLIIIQQSESNTIGDSPNGQYS